VHPNEVLDGAIINPYRGMGIETYHIQNHPIIRELYRGHGRELCFAGVVITIGHNNELENQRAANIVANLAKWVLGADGAILTKSGGGAAEASLSQTATRCEEIGVKTVLTVHEMAADSNPESCTLFNPERIDAVISMGSAMDMISLPAMKRIIGNPVDLPDGKSIAGENERMLRWIRGGWSQLGNSRLMAVRS
jgi:glycine reductase